MELKKLTKIHEGKFLSYYEADFLNNDNKIKKYEFISRDKNLNEKTFGNDKPAGVGMLCYNLDKTKVLVQKEFRLACNKWIYNFPAGLIDEGETPVEAARRELKEETGVNLVKVDAVLPTSYASQGTSDEQMVIVVCRCEGEIVNSKDANEEIEAMWLTKEDVKKLFDNKEYMSVRTQISLWQWINE